MAEVTQDVPKGVAGTGGSFIYDQRDVLRNAEMMNRNAQLEAMQRARQAAQQQMMEQRQRDMEERMLLKPGKTGFYTLPFEEYSKQWQKLYFKEKDPEKARAMRHDYLRHYAAAESADEIVRSRINESQRDTDFDQVGYYTNLKRSLAENSMKENMEGRAYDGTSPVMAAEQDWRSYSPTGIGSRVLKKNVGTNEFVTTDKTGQVTKTYKMDAIANKNGELDIDFAESVLRADPRGNMVLSGMVRDGVPREQAIKSFFPSFSFTSKETIKPGKSGPKPKEPTGTVGLVEADINYNYTPAGQSYSQDKFPQGVAKIPGFNIVPTSTRGLPPVSIAKGTRVTYLDNPVGADKKIIGGGQVLDQDVVDITDRVATVVPIATSDFTVGNKAYRRGNFVDPADLKYLAPNQVTFDKGIYGTPLYFQDRVTSSTDQNETTTINQMRIKPGEPGKKIFVPERRVFSAMTEARRLASKQNINLDKVLQEQEKKYRAMMRNSKSASRFAAPKSKPKQLSSIDK